MKYFEKPASNANNVISRLAAKYVSFYIMLDTSLMMMMKLFKL